MKIKVLLLRMLDVGYTLNFEILKNNFEFISFGFNSISKADLN